MRTVFVLKLAFKNVLVFVTLMEYVLTLMVSFKMILDGRISLESRDRVADKKRLKRLKLRGTIKIYSKQFWNLVRKAEKKSGSLSAIKDENGNLITNLALVERIVLEQLSLIFSGQRSPVFTNRNEQIIKEAQTKDKNT